MTIVRTHYRYKRPPGRKKPVTIEQTVVTPSKRRKASNQTVSLTRMLVAYGRTWA